MLAVGLVLVMASVQSLKQGLRERKRVQLWGPGEGGHGLETGDFPMWLHAVVGGPGPQLFHP